MSFQRNPIWYSIKTNVANVHHNNEKCLAGRSIAPEYVAHGTGDRPLCRLCERLNKSSIAKPLTNGTLGRIVLAIIMGVVEFGPALEEFL
jgi:hypothetical protein